MGKGRRHAAQRLDESTENAFTILCLSRRLRKLVYSEPISPLYSPNRSRSCAYSDIRGTHSHRNTSVLGRCQCGTPLLIDSQHNLKTSCATVVRSTSIILCNGTLSEPSRHDTCSSMAKTQLRSFPASPNRRQCFALICCAHSDRWSQRSYGGLPNHLPYKEYSQEKGCTSVPNPCTESSNLTYGHCHTSGEDTCAQRPLPDGYSSHRSNRNRSSTQPRRRQPPNMERLRTLDFGDEESYFSTDSSESESDDDFIGETWSHWVEC